MEKIRPGICSLDGKHPDADKYKRENQELFLAVHPFYRKSNSTGKRVFEDEKSNYFNAVNSLLSIYSGPIVVMETTDSMPEVESHLISTGKLENRFLIETEIFSAVPTKISFSDLTEFLESIRHGSINVLGGYLIKNITGKKLGGCLGGVLNELARTGIDYKLCDSMIYSLPISAENCKF